MSQKNFAITPSVSISRSKFVRPSIHKTSLQIGKITPIYLDEVLPGDTHSIDIGSLIRMSNPAFPIMDNIYLDYYAFFCPNRLVWDHWKEFMGENTSSAGAVEPGDYQIPMIEVPSDELDPSTLGNHFGLPRNNGAAEVYYASALPFRMYGLIYNTWFRDQNLIAPVYVNTGDDTSEDTIVHFTQLFNAAKESDYFTRALPYAQKGSPVNLPLGTTADIKMKGIDAWTGDNDNYPILQIMDTTDDPVFLKGNQIRSKLTGAGYNAGDPIFATYWGTSSDTDVGAKDYGVGVAAADGSVGRQLAGSDLIPFYDPNGSLYADLSTATAATINDLRFAFQYQKMLEKDALYGTRYWEILKGHFGVEAPDASLQRPEYLGHWRQDINIDQVLQTTGTDVEDPTKNTLGTPGANSVTAGRSHLFTKSFCEHGYIMILAVARHKQTYCQGLNRMWTRKDKTDFYFPEFANLGAQKVMVYELVAGLEEWDDAQKSVFGFQEAWSEYRYKPSLATGEMNPYQGQFGFASLASVFADDEIPVLNQEFIEQTSADLSRVVASGTNDQFICDFAFRDVAVRPMPMYSIPGLIDHH